MRHSYTLAALSLLAIGTLLLNPFKKSQSDVEAVDKKIPGAFHALQMWSDQRAYPAADLSGDGFMRGFEQVQEDRSQHEAVQRSSHEWKSLGPHNTAGRMLAIAFNPQNPNTIFAGSASGGLWVTYTEGLGAAAWQRVETGFPVLGVNTIAIHPTDSNVMYIGTGEVYNHTAAGTGAAYRSTRGSYGIGILKTTDGGVTWTKALDWTMDMGRGVSMIKINPLDPNVVYAGTSEGVYKSVDGGANWNQVHNVVMATDILIHPTDTNKVIAGCGNFGSAGHGLYYSGDGGGSWTKITTGVPSLFNGKVQLSLAPAQPDRMFASIGNGFSGPDGATWLCRSDDGGENWTIQNTTDYSKWQGWFAHDIACHPTDPNTLIAIGIDIWRTTNGGNTLLQMTAGGVILGTPPIDGPDGAINFSHSDHHDVVYHPTNPNIVYFANDGGVYRSIDGGDTYRSCNGGLQTTQFYNGISVSQQDSLFMIGGLQDNSTISYDGTLAWKRNIGGDGSWSAVNALDDDIVYASYQFLNIRVSFDQTGVWGTIPDVPPAGETSFIAPYVLGIDDPEVVYAGRDIVFKSTSAGGGWTATNGGAALDFNACFAMSVAPQNSDVLYVATAPNFGRGHVYVTTDGGASYTDITGILPDRYCNDLEVDPNDEATVYAAMGGYGISHLYKSTDYGTTWTDIGTDLPDLPASAVAVDPANSDHVYVGNDVGVYFSDDGGLTWVPWMSGLPEAVLVMDMKVSPSDRTLRLGSHGSGMWQRKLEAESNPPSTGIDPIQSMEVLVGPNPFSNNFTLGFALFEPGEFELVIVSLDGKVVDRQIHSLAAGKHSLSYANPELDNGTYLLQLFETGEGAGRRFTQRIVRM